jgi:hypothetical protein
LLFKKEIMIMKFIKHFLQLNLLILSCITLVSCGSSSDSSDDSPDDSPADSPVLNILQESEPNDSIATANAVTVESDRLMATIGNSGVDTDYYSFTINTVGIYSVNPSVLCDIDQQVWLYDTDGVTLLIDAQDDDGGLGPDNSEENCETIVYTFSSIGTYFLRVEELGQNSEGSYAVEIKRFTLTSDEAEPNDSFGTASPITVGAATFAASIGDNGLDTDYFSFVVDTTGVEYTINPSVGCTFDQQVWLYGIDGVTPLINGQDSDNGVGPNNHHPNCETIAYTFMATGTYFLRVEELSQASPGNYGIEISRP